MNFKEWLGQYDTQVDEREIDAVYDKAHIAVDLVRQYRPELLHNISTIANLATGAYGLYNSGENQHTLDPSLEQRLIYRGKIPKERIKEIPRKILAQYFPNVDPKQIRIGDTIRINVRRILSQAKSELEAVLQIAATIIHEATHELEYEQKGLTQETTPRMEEQKFMNWAKQNLQNIIKQYPELQVSFTPNMPLNRQPFSTAS